MSSLSLPAIKGLLENSLIEWPGKISVVLFLGGCNFRCPFCHSRQLVLGEGGRESIPFESVRELLVERSGWIDGVVVSGGEPTIASGLRELLLQLKGLGVATRVNTNGSRPGVLKALAAECLIDSVAMDVKAPLDKRYDVLAGVEVDMAAIGETVDWLLAGSVREVEFRTTVIPSLLSREDVLDVAKRLGQGAEFVLQAFRPLDCLEESCQSLSPVRPEDLVGLAEEAGRFVKSCQVRGAETAAASRSS